MIAWLKSGMFALLWSGFTGLFYAMVSKRYMARFWVRTKTDLEINARRRLLQQREDMLASQKRAGLYFKVEQILYYSGIKRRLPGLTAEWAVLLQIGLSMGCILVGSALFSWQMVSLIMLGIHVAEFGTLLVMRMREKKRVNENLMKLLDFLGNYSITTGELTGIFAETARYMEEPIKSALELCCNEAKTTGDISTAMIYMAERIEHPQFKEMVRNLEISSRYCADLKLLVHNSRRSLREYLRLQQERKSLLREAGIDMALLLLMAVFALLVVDRLIVISIWQILLFTWAGRGALFGIGFIFVLFVKQVLQLID